MGRRKANPVYPAISPFKINCNVTLRLHSPDFSVLPFIRKCRKQQDIPFPALDKHLCNCSCKAKIPIDLERRVCTQHVGINAASHTGDIFLPGITELVFQKPQCMFPVPESGPEAGLPCMHHPVPSSPRLSRATRQASRSSGFFSVIRFPGQRPYRWDT